MDIDKPPPIPYHSPCLPLLPHQNYSIDWFKNQSIFKWFGAILWPLWPNAPHFNHNNNNNSLCQDNSFIIIDIIRCALFLFTFFFWSCANFGFASTKNIWLGSWMGRPYIAPYKREKGRPCVDIGKIVHISSAQFSSSYRMGYLLPRYIHISQWKSKICRGIFKHLPLCTSFTESDYQIGSSSWVFVVGWCFGYGFEAGRAKYHYWKWNFSLIMSAAVCGCFSSSVLHTRKFFMKGHCMA